MKMVSDERSKTQGERKGTALSPWSSEEKKEDLEGRCLINHIVWTQENLVAENTGRKKVASTLVGGE